MYLILDNVNFNLCIDDHKQLKENCRQRRSLEIKNYLTVKERYLIIITKLVTLICRDRVVRDSAKKSQLALLSHTTKSTRIFKIPTPSQTKLHRKKKKNHQPVKNKIKVQISQEICTTSIN